MSRDHFEHNENRIRFADIYVCCAVIILSGIVTQASVEKLESPLSPPGRIENAFIVTQLDIRNSTSHQRTATAVEQQASLPDWFLRPQFGGRARLVKVYPDLSKEIMCRDFHSACDPAISFDASHILFAAKRKTDDDWNIYEMEINGSNIRQITSGIGNCRSPGYQAMLYTIVSPEPWYQLTFVGSEKGTLNESGVGVATNLYSCKLDGSEIRRLTFNLSSDTDPFIMSDGRLLFASRQRSTLNRGSIGRVSVFGLNIDGTDFAAFCTNQGRPIKRMPCTTTQGLAVFIEADKPAWDGSGSIGCVKLRRPLKSYREVTRETDGLFHSPSPLPDGRILVSRRSQRRTDTHGVYRLDPSNGKLELIFDSPNYHDIQAKIVHPRPEPDGRSSVVKEQDPNGKLFCLNVYLSDLKKPEWMSQGTIKRLRVLEGIPLTNDTSIFQALNTEVPVHSHNGIPNLAQRRILGEIDVEEDGSFNIEIPANTPIELQTLDADGMAMRSCGWIWAKNHEPRGCIGCHEDGELTPENILVEAITNPSVKLTLPPERRRTVDFRRDVMPIIAKKCAHCHGRTDAALRLTHETSPVTPANEKACFNQSYTTLLAAGSRPDYGKYVHPGRARTSPLIWRIFGRNTSRPWDNTFSPEKVAQMPPNQHQALSTDEKLTFVEWIDMGAMWDGIPGPDNLPGYNQNNEGGNK